MMKRTLLVAVLSFCAGACRHAGPSADLDAAPAPPPGTVLLAADSPMLKQIRRAAVSSRELPTDEIVAPGKIEANPNRVSKVVLPVAGRVVNVLVKTGDAVRKDDPLLSIDSPDADAAIFTYLSSQASMTQARAALAKAQADFDRSSDLFGHNAIAHKDVLAAESVLTQSKAAIEQAQALQEQALRRLTVLGLAPGAASQRVVLRAPLGGKVLELSVVPGEYRNDLSASVMTIADLSTVWVTSQVPESYIRFVQPGERVEISLIAYPGEVFEGRVSRIADTLDAQTRSVKVQAELDNRHGRFRPEMYGSIHHVESTRDMLVVPATAIVQDDEQAVVFVEESPGQFKERAVSLGKPAGDVVRVLSGLAPGDVVAVDGVMLLKGLIKRT